MGDNAIPDNQQRPLDLALEGAEEFDDLFGERMAPGKKRK